ncbi:MAG: translation elongation factor G [Candidatus Melainabacteria bacterium RIFOXYA12_FULL_32_12]|nr:MAG: translation elongation factor G [Candidatus Melainabacteria bacterium RIFOXYA2_FULL_32_9]OGI26509.1 MAG: translation elongation factor G [Candidatus Melainabacteria bacterium RIFOXYA12_FULL_32_12]
MSNYDTSDIRNVGLVSHVGTGKTSLADAMLFSAGQNTRLGKVDTETSLMDFEPEEVKRRTTISSSIASFNWKKARINLIDTPGGANFVADARNSLQGMDSAIIVIDAIDGLKLQSIKLIKQAQELELPLCVFINKLERENANYKTVIDKLNSTFEGKPVLLQLPIGQESSFKGVIDLLKMKALIFELNESGKFTEQDIPAELKAEAESMREATLESIVECDDATLEKYLEGADLTEEEITSALKKGILNRQITPVMFGAATKNVGVHQILNFIADYMPSPIEKGAIKVKKADGSEQTREPASSEPLAALVFKTIADPYAGQLTIMRVFSGEINSDTNIYNSTKKAKERVGQMLHLVGKKQEPTAKAVAGDIIAVAKLKDSHTGDSFSDEKNPVTIPAISQPAPVISFAIKPKSKGDEDKIQSSLKRLMEEDPTLQVSRDLQTKEIILSGMGQVHLDVAIEKLKRKFGVEVILETPKIPYKETITSDAKVQGKYKKQSGGKGQYGDCWIELHSIDKNKDMEFIDKVVGGAIPRQYIPAVESGIREAMQEGVLAGYPTVGIQVVLFDGSYHPVDSSEMAFKVAGSMAFKKAAAEARPVLLEPVMHVEITVPEENVGDIMGDLNSRRGRMQGVEAEGATQTVKAQIPMAEMLKYAPDLNSMTSGAGIFTMEFSHYEEVPAHLAQKIIEENKTTKETTAK